MIVTVDNFQILKLKNAIEGTGRKLKAELAVAVNKTASKSKSIIAKQIGSELATAQKNIRTVIKQGKRANKFQLTATVEVSKTDRIPLRDFGARQTKKGVSYRVSKKAGRKTAAGAFQGPKPGLMKASWRGRVFKRVGSNRLPIVQLYGPSTWGVFVVGKKIGPSTEQTQTELLKQINERIRFLGLKKSGAI